MQEPSFFNLTIEENLRMFAPNITLEEMDTAAKLACIYDFIQELPDKYNTLIGEKGIKLSGGQKQRLAIARLLIHNPQIAILDEATSSLDSVTETAILTNLNEYFKGRTLIVISHKPALQIDFDEKILVENGKVIKAQSIVLN